MDVNIILELMLKIVMGVVHLLKPKNILFLNGI
jgi:hypothetical protein